MSRGLENFTPFIEAVTSDYPWGNVKDGTGIGDGTDVNKINHSDYHQTFRRLLSLAGINPNGLQDNITNGYQYIQALDNLYKSFNGAVYTAVTLSLSYLHKRKIIVAQATTTPIQIVLPQSAALVNGETITIVNNGNLPVTVSAYLGEFINVFGVSSADINMYQKGDYMQLALDASINTWVIVNYKITAPPTITAPTLLNSWTAYSGATPSYEIVGDRVFLNGAFTKTGANTGVVFNLPVNARPSIARHVACIDGQNNTINYLTVSTTGDVTIVVPGTSSLIFLDGLNFGL